MASKRPELSLADKINLRIDQGYSMKIGTGKGEYPPFKLDPFSDRAAFRQYVRDCIEEVCASEDVARTKKKAR